MDKTYEFIVNLHSRTGKAKEIWKELESVLREREVSYRVHITEYIHHATKIAQELTAGDEHCYLVVAGGDGTVNEVLNGIRDLSKVTFGYLPLGSANDFARGLKITGEPREILMRLLDSEEEEKIDLGEVICSDVTRRFCISAGAGLDAAVCRRALTSTLKKMLNRFHLGGLTYGILTVLELFKSPRTSAKVVAADGTVKEFRRVIFTAGMNFSCEGGGVPMTPGADARDGVLSVCLLHGLPRLICLLCFPFLLTGKHEGIPAFSIWEAKEVQMTFSKPMVIHADGEDCGDQDNVIFRCIPQALRMPVLR